MKIIIKTLFLSILWNYFNVGIKSLNKYDTNIKFSVYRSVCCLTIFIYALINIIKVGKRPINNPFFSTSFDINDLNEWFISYLIHDLISMGINKNERIELWFHHILALITFTIPPMLLKNSPYLLNVLLLSEIMSAFSGIDSMYIKDNNMISSMYCKKIRKFVIKYIRTPIWIYSTIVAFMHYNKLPKLVFLNCMVATITLPLMDYYWAKKCQKVIDKYSQK